MENKRGRMPSSKSQQRSVQPMNNQQVYKQVAKALVKIPCTYTERKCALHLIFIPWRRHSFCSFNGFRQLGWNSGKQCLHQKHIGACVGRQVNTRAWFTAASLLKSMCFLWLESKMPVSVGWQGWRKTPLMWLPSERKNTKAQLRITARGLLKGSIREMLTFVQGTIGCAVPNVNQNGLV